jgi:hypothetical protein
MDKMLQWTLQLGQNVTVDVVNLDVTSRQLISVVPDRCPDSPRNRFLGAQSLATKFCLSFLDIFLFFWLEVDTVLYSTCTDEPGIKSDGSRTSRGLFLQTGKLQSLYPAPAREIYLIYI